MVDLIATHAIQFATITAAAMALSEWFPLPVGSNESPRNTRRRASALAYAASLGVAGLEAGLVSMPGDGRIENYLGVLVSGVCSVAAAHFVVKAKKATLGGKE